MTDPKDQQPLTLATLLPVMQRFRDEDGEVQKREREAEKELRKEEFAKMMVTLKEKQDLIRTELRKEFSAEIRRICTEVSTLRAHISLMGGSTFVDRVCSDTIDEQNDKETGNPTDDKSPSKATDAAPPLSQAFKPQPCATSTAHMSVVDPLSPPPPEAHSHFVATSNLSSDIVRPAITPTEYDGKTPWRRYAMQFEAVSQANGWTASLQAIYLATFLRGTALAFYETLDRGTRNSYEKLNEAFQLRFGTDHQQTIAHWQLRSRVQRNGESLAEFATEVQRLTHLTFGDCPEGAKDRIALEQFLDGIAELEIQERVRDSAPHTLQVALQTAARIEASHRATRAARRNIRAAAVTTLAPRRRRPPTTPNEREYARREEAHTPQQQGNEQELAQRSHS